MIPPSINYLNWLCSSVLLLCNSVILWILPQYWPQIYKTQCHYTDLNFNESCGHHSEVALHFQKVFIVYPLEASTVFGNLLRLPKAKRILQIGVYIYKLISSCVSSGHRLFVYVEILKTCVPSQSKTSAKTFLNI